MNTVLDATCENEREISPCSRSRHPRACNNPTRGSPPSRRLATFHGQTVRHLVPYSRIAPLSYWRLIVSPGSSSTRSTPAEYHFDETTPCESEIPWKHVGKLLAQPPSRQFYGKSRNRRIKRINYTPASNTYSSPSFSHPFLLFARAEKTSFYPPSCENSRLGESSRLSKFYHLSSNRSIIIDVIYTGKRKKERKRSQRYFLNEPERNPWNKLKSIGGGFAMAKKALAARARATGNFHAYINWRTIHDSAQFLLIPHSVALYIYVYFFFLFFFLLVIDFSIGGHANVSFALLVRY